VLGCNWKIFEATEITSAHVVLRNGVTTYSNTFEIRTRLISTLSVPM